jgi:hypothetical protein
MCINRYNVVAQQKEISREDSNVEKKYIYSAILTTECLNSERKNLGLSSQHKKRKAEIDFFLNRIKICPYRKKEYPALRYKVLSGDSFESPIFFLQLLLAIALDIRPA